MATTDNNHGKRATIRGVASAAGVSIATVSRVLNGRPDVAPETREAVLRAVREQGFSTNRNARALSGGRTGLIGVTIPLVEAAYFGVDPLGRVRGALRAGHADRALPDPPPARPRGDAARPPDARDDRRRRAHAPGGVERGAEGAADGTSRSSSSIRASRSTRGSRSSRRRTPPAPAQRPSTCSRSGTGGSARSPARATGSPARERLNGYHGALGAAGVLPDPALVAESDFRNGPVTENAAASAARPARSARPRSSRSTTTSRSASCARRGRAACASPRTSPSSASTTPSRRRSSTPPLTTVRQPLAEMGRMAVSLLLRLLENQRHRRAPDRARDEARRARVDRAGTRRTLGKWAVTEWADQARREVESPA